MEKQINIKGIKLNYRQVGNGDPMIIMHGWGCDSGAMAMFERVGAEHHTVYNLDLPGFGKSQEPSTPWTVEDYTRMLEAFVEAQGISAPILLGHSFGGRVAILYASRNEVSKLILVDAAGVKPRRSLSYYIKVYSFKLARRIYPLIVGKEKAGKKIEAMRSKRGSDDYKSSSPVMRQVLVKAVNSDLKHVMPSITAPTLLIWGEEDTATPMRDARIMNKLIANSRLVSFAGAGHFSFVDNPYQVTAAVRRFIQPND